MSWHDAINITDELDEDRTLRDELQHMLGLPPVKHPDIASTPDTVALAQSLHREAMRRRRTASGILPQKGKRPFILIAATTIPVLFTVIALGTWSIKLKRQAATLAAEALELESKTLELESRQNRMDNTKDGPRSRENAPILQASENNQAATPESGEGKTPHNTGELVKPEERPSRLNSQPDQYRVNDRR
ncbi:MAG: hypothetical protein FWG02_10330 [Holophagaceae bacterium]|nr:hypothetical protein [Holophagaceae bacterium]